MKRTNGYIAIWRWCVVRDFTAPVAMNDNEREAHRFRLEWEAFIYL